ncbi:protein NDR1-like [Hordeum vulgare]|nr:protein NDR1-like [Hordeum vulgare]
MPPPQTSTAAVPEGGGGGGGGGRSRARRIAHRTRDSCVSVLCSTLCSVLLAVILVAGVALFVAWLSLRPHRPRFALASFSLSGPVPGGKAAFNVSDRNPNRHIGIYYDGATRASLRFYDALVASGPAFPAGWYQPNMTTVSVAGVLDVLGPTPADPAAWHSFSAALQAGRLALRLELTFTGVRFRVTSVFQQLQLRGGRQRMHVKCDVVVGVDGKLLRDSLGAPCDRYL